MGYADAVNQLAPSAYWRMGESAWGTFKDQSGNSKDLTASGTVTNFTPAVAGLVPGDPDKALSVNVDSTVSGQLKSPTGSWLNSTDLSASFIVKRTAAAPTSDYAALLSTRDTSGSPQWSIYLPSTAAHSGFSGKVNLLGIIGTGSTSDFTLATTNSVCDGNVHHIVITINGMTWTLYRNGQQESQITVASALYAGVSPGTSYLNVGSEGLVRGLNGVIDEVAVWMGTVLTSAQIATLYREFNRGGVIL